MLKPPGDQLPHCSCEGIDKAGAQSGDPLEDVVFNCYLLFRKSEKKKDAQRVVCLVALTPIAKRVE